MFRLKWENQFFSIKNNYLQIPFLSSSEGIGQIKIRERSSSFVIEDCLCGNNNEWKRRLRFDDNPNLIQSEINLTSNDRMFIRNALFFK